jgi:mono/diheme cytochrome c family protein
MPTPSLHPAHRLSSGLAALATTLLLASCGGNDSPAASAPVDPQVLAAGRQTFRFDTFGDEAQWTDSLRMHEVIETGVSPNTALAVGLKVDADALPSTLVDAIKAGQVDLDSPATTLALIKLDAVVGIKGQVETVNGVDRLRKVGVTCALCHSSVDDSFAKGIGKRLDGWPNRDLNPGAIIALSPALDARTKAIYQSWGKGKFDPRFNVDGLSNPVVIPPAYGLAGIDRVTYTGDGSEIAYWNRYVSVVEMGGLGTFDESRLNLHVVHGTTDLVTSKLPALQAYQLSLAAPAAPVGTFDAVAAVRGQALFAGKAQCASCHSGSTFTDANTTLHTAAASMAEPESPSYAGRSATGLYRTGPLRGAWQHAPYFHDGSAATLDDVAQTYNQRQQLGLTANEVKDLAHYLRSL